MGNLTFASGTKLLGARNYQALYTDAISALQANEKDPLAFFFLGIVASDNGQKQKALEFFNKACDLAPQQSRYQAYFARALLGYGALEAAKQHVDIAHKLGTKDPLISDMIGTVYSRLGDHRAALPHFRRAVKANPRWAVFQFNLAASAQFLGDVKTANAAYKAALALDPKFYRAWFSLVSLKKQTADNNHLETLNPMFLALPADSSALLLIGHSIAKTYEDLGQYVESLAWLGRAKRLKTSEVKYDPAEIATIFNAAKSSSIENQGEAVNDASPTPIFIIGLPRTGTTLIDRILSSHPDVASAGELGVISRMIKAKAGSPSPNFLDAQTLDYGGDFEGVARDYAGYISTLAGDAEHIIDKTPLNFLYAGLIHRALPNAKIIALRRGAMDSCLSNYRQLFAPQISDYDYTYDLLNTAHFYREFDSLIANWRSVIPTGNFMEIHYEDIVQDQESQTRQLLGFCGLNWDERCMRFHENTSAVDSASSMQVRQPLYAGSIGRWKQYGEGLDDLRAALGDLAQT